MKRLLLAAGLWAALVGCTQKASPPAQTTPAAQTSEQNPGAPEAAAPINTRPAPPAGQPIPARWKADVNYYVVAPSQPTAVNPGEVEVVEFLWLGCPHCYALNPYVEAWKKQLPAYIKFTQVPVTWDASRVLHARLFYTLATLGGDTLVVKAFDEIHGRHNFLIGNDDADTEKLQQAFAVANGVDAAAFKSTYNSFAVNSSLQRANQLVRAYRIDGVPTFIVNGKYRTGLDEAGGPEQLMELLDDLAASEKR
jgi:thiol:disulfide interchange protein DsbA